MRASSLVQGPPAFPVQSQDLIMESHQGRPVTNGDAGAAQLLDDVAEALLHVHLRARGGLMVHSWLSNRSADRSLTEQDWDP